MCFTSLYSFKPLCLDHCNSKYLNWLLDPDVNEFLEIPSTVSIEDLKSFVLGGLKVDSNRLNLAFYSHDQHIGNASLYVTERTPPGSFQFGWFVGDKSFWGGNTSSCIMYLLFEIGFTTLGFESCIGSVLSSHLKARMANRYVGFTETHEFNFYRSSSNSEEKALSLFISSDQWYQRRSELNKLKPDLYPQLHIDQELQYFIMSHHLCRMTP